MRANRQALVVLVIALLISLVPLAHASPTDPTWMPGFWDDADHDDVVLLAASGIGIGGSHIDPPRWALFALGRVRDSANGAPFTRPLTSACPRAPPA